ncbi:MAG TPA: protein kinase [Polyangiaceae bacterium]|nr:protein kinase [Polyangiaceae bacterium]
MAGEYRLLRKLGEGGFGAVYEAEHPLLKRRAAVKVLHRVADKDSDAVLRFISEAQAVNQIRNRHIIDVFSFGQLSDGRHYYIMDLLDGLPLDRFLKQQGKLDVASALQLLTPIAEALDLAHAAGIVHRDLKPQNIFLAWDGSGETIPKLLDFGMAKLLGESPVHTVSGTPIGTPLYMSPEQARGDRVDHRSDVYALGVLCHELITGHLPFTGDTTVAVLMAHIIQTPAAASEVESSLSPLLDAPLLRMLEKDPTKRPASAGEAVAALRQAAGRAGVTLHQGPLRLPRPDATISGERLHEGADTILQDFETTEPEERVAASAGTTTRTPLWPFAVGLIAAGAALGFAVLRAPSAEPKPEPAVSARPAEPQSVVVSPPSAVAPASGELPAPVAEPSALASTSAAPTPSIKAPANKPGKALRPESPARIPRDLENPF